MNLERFGVIILSYMKVRNGEERSVPSWIMEYFDSPVVKIGGHQVSDQNQKPGSADRHSGSTMNFRHLIVTSLFRVRAGKKKISFLKKRSNRKILVFPDLLEHRLMPAIFIVTNTSDSGAGSLRQAILDANANTTDALDTIQFNSSLAGQTITLSSMVTVNDASAKSLLITGSGAANLTITGGNSTGLIRFNTSTTISDLKLGSTASDNVILPGTNCLTLAKILLSGSLTANGSANNSCITVNGTISATGNGAISLTARNAIINSRVSTQSGNISITADNGNFQTGTFAGIEMNGTAANLSTSGGNINLKGRGGSSGSPPMAGVCITQGSLYAGGSGGITILAQSTNNTSTAFSFTNGVIATNGGNIVFFKSPRQTWLSLAQPISMSVVIWYSIIQQITFPAR